MAVTIFNTTLTAGPASAGARTLLHTGTDQGVLLVWIHSNEATTYSAVAVGTLPLTRIAAVSSGTSRSELWWHERPPSGVGTISAIPAGTQVATWCMAATTYTGQRQIGGSPLGTVAAASASGAAVVLPVSSTSTDLIAFGFGFSAANGATLTIGNAGATVRGTATHSTTGRLVVGDIAGAATVSLSAAASISTATWALIAQPIIASAAATTTIVFDNAAGTASSGAVNSIGLLLTATTNAVLIVFINTDSSVTISAVNVGVLPMTLLGGTNYQDGFSRAEIWGLTAPPSGVLTISAVIAGGNVAGFGIAGITYTGHKTTGPFGGVVISTATAVASTSVIVSSTAGNVVVLGFANRMFNPASVSAGPGLVNRFFGGAYPSILVADTAGGPSISASAFATSAISWASFGINLIQEGGLATRNGSATMTDAPDTFAASGYVLIQGSLAATDAADTFSAPSRVIIQGTFAATDAPDTFAASAGARVRGSLSATDAADTFVATGAVRITGLLSATDAPDSFAATGQVVITGLLAATDAPDTFVGLGGETPAVRSATFAATDAADMFAATGTSDSATGTAPPATVVTITTDSGAGSGRKRKNKPPYIRAPDTFWESRKLYLESLQPEIDSEPEPVPQPLNEPEIVVSTPVNPQLVAYRIERQELISALPLATSMRKLRAGGDRLIRLNAQIAEQKRLQLAADLAIRKAERRARKLARLKPLKRKALLLVAAQVALALSHVHRNY